MAALDVITVDQARAGLGLNPSDDGVDSAELARLVSAASAILDDRCGPVIQRQVTVDVDGGTRYLFLAPPVASVTSVTEWPAGTAVTGEVRGAETSDDFRLGAWGRLERRSAGSPATWADGVVIAYTAGRFPDVASVSAKFVAACQIIVSHLWRAERGAASQTFGAYDQWPAGITATGVPTFGVPRAALDLLAGELLPPAVA